MRRAWPATVRSVAGPFGGAGSLRPYPSRSGTITRYPAGNSGTTRAQRWEEVGNPCTSNRGSPAPRLPLA